MSGPCDAAIRPLPNDVEIRCHVDHPIPPDRHFIENVEHEGTLHDYAGPGSTSMIVWFETDRRTFHGEWPGPCSKPNPCVLPNGHRGRCAP